MTPTSSDWRDHLAVQIEPLLRRACDAGVGSALALGVITTTGQRATCVVGHTTSVQRRDGRLVPLLGQAVTSATPFDLASLTKPMVTTTLLAGAVATAGWDLDQPLHSILPAAVGTALGGQPLRALLGHRSGAIAWHDFYGDVHGDLDAGRDASAAVQRAVLSRPLRTSMNGAVAVDAVYSDLGFIALGHALEVGLGGSLDALFAERIAVPLGLDAHFRPSAAKADFASRSPAATIVATEIWPRRCPDGLPLQGEVHDDNCLALGGVAGHAGLFASLDDVLTWARTWLQAACGLDSALGERLPPALAHGWLRQAEGGLHRTHEKPVKPTSESTWRLGFDTPSAGMSSAGARVGLDAFGHLGFTGTSVWLDPSRQAAVVLLTNRVHPTRNLHGPIKALRPAVHDAVWHLLDARLLDPPPNLRLFS